MKPSEYRAEWRDLAHLQADFHTHFNEGAVLIRGEQLAEMSALCTVVLVHPSSGCTLPLQARAVFANAVGVGLALEHFDAALLDRLKRFIASEAVEGSVAPQPARDEHRRTSPTNTLATKKEAEPHRSARRGTPNEHKRHTPNDEQAPHEVTNVHERIRQLSPAECRRLATTGTQAERGALERAYGKDMWDPLLSNPRITVPEVARIARMGALPIPLIERIVAHSAWVSSPQVRRALLSNPRLRGPSMQKVLKSASKNELRLIQQGSSYPPPVRETARKLLGR